MRNPGFQKFVAIFVGIILVFAFTLSIIGSDEQMLGMSFALAGLYAVYLVIFFRREKERKAKESKSSKSPLLK